MIDDSGKNRNY